MLIDNPNKDLVEVWDQETGVLLGWLPVNIATEKHQITYVESDTARSAITQCDPDKLPPLKRTHFQLDDIYIMGYKRRIARANREIWEEIKKNYNIVRSYG